MVEVCTVFFLLSLVARFLDTIDVCIWSMFVFMSVVIVWGSVRMIVVWRLLLKILFFSLGVFNSFEFTILPIVV